MSNQPLSDADIIREETLRHQIRRELSAKERKWWHFFNSAFGLWFMSTIVVGIVTFVYTKVEKRAEAREQAEQRIKALEMELNSRLIRFRDRLDEMSERLTAERKNQLKPEGWYGGLRKRYRAAEQPVSSYSPELRPLGVERLLDSLSDAYRDASRLDGQLESLLKDSKTEWKRTTKVCSDEYDPVKIEKYTDRQYYDLMEQHCGSVLGYLRKGSLKAWIVD